MGSIVGTLEIQTVDDIKSAVLSCGDSGQGLVPIGGGSRVHIGTPATKDVHILPTIALSRISEYNPEDLVVCCEAGMTVSTLQKLLNESGQWLPVDVAQPDIQTVGGIVASRANSAIRAGFGSVRDWLIGVEVINSSGETVVGGGKVVKNVAGYDLPRLYCGSWGTLGVLTKVNFKVAMLPETERALLVVLSSDRNAEELLDHLIESTSPVAAILFNSLAATVILGPDSNAAQYVYLRFMGLAEDVDASISRAALICEPFASSITVIPSALSVKLSRQLADFRSANVPLSATYHILSSQVGAYLRMLEWTAERHDLTAAVVADAACGIVTAHFQSVDQTADWYAFIAPFKDKADRVGGSLIVERMPDAWREDEFPVWSPILSDFRIMQLLKKRLDPGNVFSPGRFIGGI